MFDMKEKLLRKNCYEKIVKKLLWRNCYGSRKLLLISNYLLLLFLSTIMIIVFGIQWDVHTIIAYKMHTIIAYKMCTQSLHTRCAHNQCVANESAQCFLWSANFLEQRLIPLCWGWLSRLIIALQGEDRPPGWRSTNYYWAGKHFVQIFHCDSCRFIVSKPPPQAPFYGTHAIESFLRHSHIIFATITNSWIKVFDVLRNKKSWKVRNNKEVLKILCSKRDYYYYYHRRNHLEESFGGIIRRNQFNAWHTV